MPNAFIKTTGADTIRCPPLSAIGSILVLLVAFLIFVDLTLHRVYAVRHGLLKGIGLFAVEQGLAGEVERKLGNLVVVALRLVDFKDYFAGSALNFTALIVVFIVISLLFIGPWMGVFICFFQVFTRYVGVYFG